MSVCLYTFVENLTAKSMGQKKHKEQKSEQLSSSEKLRQTIMNEPLGAEIWHRAAWSFSENRQREYIRIVIAVVVGVVIGALAMHFLSSPERWIRV